ncbi:MAG TPA: peptide deformylase [Elusimicrobia bacterium]|nr:MAG: peptide deformylase [Elusimicrobia bacterium GWD2_63_28]HCC47420.1 peptide deformylase [Elusimicrobiota bacterium]
MAVLGIRLYGDPVLTRKTRPVLLPSERELVGELVRNLFAAMEAFGGVGLAANQAGVPLRVAVIRIPPKEGPGVQLVLVNPEIISGEGSQTGEEGCLSFPGLFLKIKRFNKVKVRSFNERGLPVEINADGFLARALQHEIDHLDGKVFTQRLSLLARLRLKPRLARLKKEWLR